MAASARSTIDTRTLEVTKRIASPGFPYRVQFTPDGKLALVPHAQASSLVVADVASQTILKSIKLGLSPDGVTYSPIQR
jgi:DNA-binding beta-propeller fold protein YncE